MTTATKPLRLADTASQPGFDHLDSMTQWFLGGTGAAVATATGIVDDSAFGLDLLNSGSGGLSFRVQSGDLLSFLVVDNAGVLLGGTVSANATAVVSLLGPVTVVSLTSTVTTGTAPLTVASTTKVANLNADLLDSLNSGNGNGNIPISNGTVCTNLNADLLDGNDSSAFSTAAHTHAYLPLSGGTVTGAIAVTNILTVTGACTFSSTVLVGGAVTFSGTLSMTGTATFNGALSCSGTATFISAISVPIGSEAGFTQTSWGGYVNIVSNGVTRQVPYR